MTLSSDGGMPIIMPAKAPLCPVCQQSGKKVSIKTVRNLIKNIYAESLPEVQYYICMTPECSTAYYTASGLSFDKRDLTVPIWFKEKSTVPICYCKNVTDADILEHVVNRQCCSNLEDIQEHTGANTGKECLLKNPTGR